jgi:two-component system sensor histidine kinase VanS
VDRQPGLSVRLKLTLSYAGFLMVAGALLLATVWVFLLRDVAVVSSRPGEFVPIRSIILRAYAPATAGVLAFLLVFALLGGWILAGRMLAPPDPNHQRHTQGHERITLPPNPATGPQR